MIGTLGQFVRDIRDRITGVGNPIPVVTSFKIPDYDYIELSYDGAENLTSITYKTGGSAGEAVAVLILAYDGSGNLTSIAKD